MGRVTFDEVNKQTSSTDYPKLKLEGGEKARIVCLENPVVEYVHTLRMPHIENGVPKMKTVERRDGSTFEDYVQDFVGRPLCLGDEGILKDNGIDPKNCPACELAKGTDMVDNPMRRFAMHVFKYATRTGTTNIIDPFSGQLVVWAFTDKVFGKLVDFQVEHGNLQRRDLLLGPCTNPTFQQFDIGISSKAEWIASEDRINYVKTMFNENQAKDLATFCGRRQDRRFMEEDLQKIKDRWALVNGAGQSAVDVSAAETPSLTEGLDDLLSTQSGSSSSATAPVQGPAADMDDLLGDSGAARPAPEPPARAEVPPVQELMKPAARHQVVDPLAEVAAQPVQEKPAEPAMSVKPGSSGEDLSFEDLLSS